MEEAETQGKRIGSEVLGMAAVYFCVRVRNAKAQAIARRTRPLSAETVPEAAGRRRKTLSGQEENAFAPHPGNTVA